MKNRGIHASWVKAGGICGLLSLATYFSAVFVPLPDLLTLGAAFAFGPLLAVGAFGLHHCLAVRHEGPLLQTGTFFAVAGGVTVMIMLAVQQSIFRVIESKIDGAGTEAVQDRYREILEGLHSIHWGIDVAWDLLISVATILFGLSMIRHPRFGRIFGSLGVVLGGLLLSFNLYYFPVPPAGSGSVDLGPFVALWYLAVFVVLLRATSWVRENL